MRRACEQSPGFLAIAQDFEFTSDSQRSMNLIRKCQTRKLGTTEAMLRPPTTEPQSGTTSLGLSCLFAAESMPPKEFSIPAEMQRSEMSCEGSCWGIHNFSKKAWMGCVFQLQEKQRRISVRHS